jgi:glycosyltransferase involved in cell wall biosynthesis
LICTPHTGGEDLLRLQGTAPRIDPLEERSVAGAADPSPILDFPAGWVVPIHDPAAIAHCLRRLSQEAGLWEGKRRAALELAQGALGWDAYGDRAIAHYRSLLSDRDP